MREEHANVEGEDFRADQLSAEGEAAVGAAIARRYHQWAPMLNKDGLLFGLGERAPTIVFQLFELRLQVLRQLSDDVVGLRTSGQVKPHGPEVVIEQCHRFIPSGESGSARR